MEALLAQNDNLPAPASESWPKHVAIIMDGNNRWAEKHSKSRKAGHREGAEALKKLVESCAETPLKYLTVYAFSSENWNRPTDEVDDLMSLMRFYLRNEVKQLHKHNIKLAFIGDRTRLSEDLQKELKAAETLTQANTHMTLIVALSYGAREEMTRAMKSLLLKVESGELASDQISEKDITAHLDTSEWPEPELLIRTGGEKRLSNFLLWQSAYSELYFCDTLWPEFGYDDMQEAVNDYGKRERRFGARNAAEPS